MTYNVFGGTFNLTRLDFHQHFTTTTEFVIPVHNKSTFYDKALCQHFS